MAEDKKPKRPAPETPDKDAGANKSISDLIRKISETNESKTTTSDTSERLAKRQVELLEDIYKLIAEQNDRQINLMAQLTEDRKADERRSVRTRIDELEERSPKRELQGNRLGILGSLAATTGILGGLGVAFMALSTSFAALKDGATVFMKNADQAVQGLIASVWGLWKLFKGLVYSFAYLAGGITFVVVSVVGKIKDLVSMIAVIGKPVASVIGLLGAAVSGLIGGVMSALNTILWPIKEIVGAFRIIGRLSGLFTAVLIAFDAFSMAIKEFKKSGDLWKTAIAFFQGAIGSIMTTIKGVWDVFKAVGGWIAKLNGAKDSFSRFTSGVEAFFGMITYWVNEAFEFIKGLSLEKIFKFLKDSFDVTVLALTVFVEHLARAFDTWIVQPIKDVFGAVATSIQYQMSLVKLAGEQMKAQIERVFYFVTLGLEFVKHLAENLKNQVMNIPVPGFGTLENALKTGGMAIDQGDKIIKGLIAGNSEPPTIKPKENFAGKILQEAKDKARAANMTMIIAPQTIDNSTTASTNMSQKVIAPMTTVNTRDPSFAF